MKKCEYCGKQFDNNKHQRTKEHIFPQQIIEMFPEQYISYTHKGNFIDKSGITIRDVCRKCNNDLLGELDSSCNSMIKEYFLDENESYDSQVTIFKEGDIIKRWILKIAYNYLRYKKSDCNWFEYAKDYMLYGNKLVNIYFSLYMGLHVNVSPMPEDSYGYRPINIVENPRIYGTSFYTSTVLGLDIDLSSVKIPNISNSFSIRFGNAVFFLILWKDGKKSDIIKKYDNLISNNFEFERILSSKNDYIIRRISSSSNSVLGYNHFVSKSGLDTEDSILSRYGINGSVFLTQKRINESRSDIERKKTSILIEKEMFPDNEFIGKKYSQYFGDS